MRNIDTFVTPLVNYVIWDGGFTDDECDLIIESGELEEFTKGVVGNQREVVTEIRDTDIVWIQPREDQKWIFERMNTLVAKINYDKFQFNLERFDGFQYSKYQNGGHYDWHMDTQLEPPNGLFRKLSMSVMLSDENTYEGGDFLINVKGRPEEYDRVRLKKGQIIFFQSYLPHKVEPVTSGERIALVTWGLGPKPV